MCGIVGFTGKSPAVGYLIDGLRKLEYRGYDSAGVALSGELLSVVRATGKVENLAQKLKQIVNNSNCGIAHTRWATHGSATEYNAHPHCDNSGRFALVHNGIIENYRNLRSKLEARGYKFSSDTDSEVIPNLMAELYNGDIVQAFCATLRQLQGTWGIAMISREHPGMILIACSGSPVIIGVGENSNFVASDISAFTSYTRQVIYLHDGEFAVLTPEKVDIRNMNNVSVEREISRINWDTKNTGRGDYEHFMLKEIHEQPEALNNTIRGRLREDFGDAVLSGLNLSPQEAVEINRVVIAGCGSSLHAGLIGEYYLEDIACLPAEVEQSAEFRYRNPIIEPRTMVVPISQSGETADTLAAVREAINKGAIVAALSNVVGSTIARECGRGIYLHAGPEISVASTKAFSSQVVALWLLALKLGRHRRLSVDEGRQIVKEIQKIPELIKITLSQEENIRQIAQKYAKYQDFFFIGRGCLYPVALEGALKLKEISYIHAEGFHAAELKHGPISLLGNNAPVIALANDIPGRDKLLGNIQECVARHSPVIAVVTGNDDQAQAFTSDIIRVPNSSRFAAPLTTVVTLQLFAYYYAKAKGCDIDHPRNLAKSVTVE